MKQHITINQWNELNNSQRDILHKYLGIIGDTSLHGIDCPEKYYSRVLLNIGQMIEFLDEQNPLGKGFGTVKGTNGLTEYWVVTQYDKSYKADEFCDALWEAVKEVLK